MHDGECTPSAEFPFDPPCVENLGCAFWFSIIFQNNTLLTYQAVITDPSGGSTPVIWRPGSNSSGYIHDDVACGAEWRVDVATDEYWRCLCTKCLDEN
jgi:hypothetical protein